MFQKIFQILENIFLIKKEKSKYIEIFLDKTLYYKKNSPKFYLNKIFISLLYEENLQKDLKNFKYRYNKTSEELFINYYKRLFIENLNNPDKNNLIIIWVPMFYLDRFLRWYNQTYILAKWLSKELWVEYLDLIKKVKYSKNQAWLSKEKRLKNLKNCFRLNSKYKTQIKWKTIIIIDDIISTWTTVNEVAKVLKESWARDIIGLFLATWN